MPQLAKCLHTRGDFLGRDRFVAAATPLTEKFKVVVATVRQLLRFFTTAIVGALVLVCTLGWCMREKRRAAQSNVTNRALETCRVPLAPEGFETCINSTTNDVSTKHTCVAVLLIPARAAQGMRGDTRWRCRTALCVSSSCRSSDGVGFFLFAVVFTARRGVAENRIIFAVQKQPATTTLQALWMPAGTQC